MYISVHYFVNSWVRASVDQSLQSIIEHSFIYRHLNVHHDFQDPATETHLHTRVPIANGLIRPGQYIILILLSSDSR